MWTSSHNGPKAFFLEEEETAERGSAEARGIGEDRVEDWLQVVGRVRNGAQHLRDCRLLFNEFGYLPLQLGAGPDEVPHGSSSLQRSFSFMRSSSSALHREQHHNGSAAIRDSSHGCLSQKNATECPRSAVGQNRQVADRGQLFGVALESRRSVGAALHS